MKIRIPTLVVLLALALTGSAWAQQRDDRFEAAARKRAYVTALAGPSALLGITASTALDQLRDDPSSWKLTDRLLSNAGRLAVQESLHHGIAAIMGRSTWYYKCTCTDTGARVAHAFAEGFTDHDRAGATHLSVARFVGAFGGAYAESTWRPERTTADILMIGTSTLVTSGLWNLVHEF